MTSPVQIPDAAVRDAHAEYHKVLGSKDRSNPMLAALTAALPHFPLGFEVKQLEWTNLCEYGLEYRAKTSIGTYSIHTDEDSAGGRMFCYFHLTDDADCTKYGEEIYSGYDDDDTIKAAAQADFKLRVRECHVPLPDIRTIIEEVRSGKRQGFLNEGDQPEASDAELSCPHCGGSGHIDDVATKSVAVAAVRRQALEEASAALNKIVNNWGNLHHKDLMQARSAIRALSAEPAKPPYQDRVKSWLFACFGEDISSDKLERSDRFIEEALELVQAIGYSADRAHSLVDYVFNREVGEPHQEVGGVLVTLAGLCFASDIDMLKAGEEELARVWTKVDKIREKQAAKPVGSALPIPAAPTTEAGR